MRCNECRLYIHYECTRLPAYQLHQFNQKGYRKCICGSCTVDIPNDIKEHSFENEPNEELQVCIIEHTKVIDQNRSMGKKLMN